MSQGPEWHREQSEYNKRFYEWLQASRPDHADWRATALFYSALHGVNYWFVAKAGLDHGSNFVRDRRAKEEMPRAFDGCDDLCSMNMRAWYHDGHRTDDRYRQLAFDLPGRVEREIPFQ